MNRRVVTSAFALVLLTAGSAFPSAAAVPERSAPSAQAGAGLSSEAKPDSPYRAFIPPLAGTAAEVDALGDYLVTLKAN